METTLNEQRANARGFINHIVASTGASTKEAMILFNKSNEKAAKVIKRASIIRESILEAVNPGTKQAFTQSGLPANLAGALAS